MINKRSILFLLVLVISGCNQTTVKKDSYIGTRQYFEEKLKNVNFDDGITINEAQIIFENYTLACHGHLVSALTPEKSNNNWLAPVCYNSTAPICRDDHHIILDTVDKSISFKEFETINDIYNVWNLCEKKSS